MWKAGNPPKLGYLLLQEENSRKEKALAFFKYQIQEARGRDGVTRNETLGDIQLTPDKCRANVDTVIDRYNMNDARKRD